MQAIEMCANCGVPAVTPAQKFCHDCGQLTLARRIDWAFLRHEIEHGLLQIDRGVLYTLKNLFFRPGHFIREYLEGRRAGHVKPLHLLLMSAALALLLGKFLLDDGLLGTHFNEGLASSLGKEGAAKSSELEAIMANFGQAHAWVNQHLTFATLIMLPVEAAAFRLAFRRVGNLNYPEWLAITAYLTVQTFVIWSAIIIVQRWVPDIQNLLLPLCIALGTFTLVQFFNGRSRWNTALRALGGFLLFQITISLILILVAMAFAVWVMASR